MTDPTPTPTPTPTPAPSPEPTPTPAPSPEPAPTPTPAPSPEPAPAPSIPQWLEGMSDELRNDPDINRYGSVEDLAKGLKETRAWARGRVPIPTDEAGFKELGEKLRPESADKYEVAVPGGIDLGYVDAFREYAFETGLPAAWAKGISEFNSRWLSDQASKLQQENKDAVTAIELDLGTAAFNVRLEAVDNMMQRAGLEDFDVLNALEQVKGADKAMRAMFKLAESTGELEKVDGASVEMRMGTYTPQQARAEIDRMLSNDPEGKLRNPQSAESKKLKQLEALAVGRRG